MITHIIQSQSTDPRINLALEEHLGRICGDNDVWLFLWQNSDTIVIGRNQNPWRECRVSLLKKDGIFLVRRNSGGGAVFHDLGNINFTFIASKHLYDLDKQLKTVLTALSSFGIQAEFSGRNDITAGGRKFSGNAFTHKKNVSIQHGTLLVNSDMDKLSRYLTASKAKLQSKGVASTRSRVCNLSELCPSITMDQLKSSLHSAFNQVYQAQAVCGSDICHSDYSDLIDKFSSDEWTFMESPAFAAQFEARFSWGEVQLYIETEHGLIKNARLFSDAMDADFILSIAPRLKGLPFSAENMASAVDASQAQGAELKNWLLSLEL
ncbi:MAG TPA: lipoate--protein ligase [Firmicutes bacterium]|nr:lipoate--protein ligase [Bacillota bacterium]